MEGVINLRKETLSWRFAGRRFIEAYFGEHQKESKGSIIVQMERLAEASSKPMGELQRCPELKRKGVSH